jgi:hypothetical protein
MDERVDGAPFEKHRLEVEDYEVDFARRLKTSHANVVTQIVQHPNYCSFNVWLAGGDLTGVLSLLEEGEEYAKANGCLTMEVTGQRGWKRILAPHGFHEEAVVLHKEL